MSRRSLARFQLVWLTLLVASAALPISGAAAPRSRPLALLPAAEFEKLPALHTPLAAGHLNHSLLAAALFHATNQVRREHGLTAFRWLPQLDEAADLQANSAALDQAAGHINLLPPLLTMTDRLERVKLPAGRAAENAALLPLLDLDPAHGIQISQRDNRTIAADEVTGRIGQPHTYASFAASAVKAWMDSTGHRANILNPDLESLGCSGRATKRLASIEMIACVQVFYTALRSQRSL